MYHLFSGSSHACRLSSLVSQEVRQKVKLGYYQSYPHLVSQLDSIIKSFLSLSFDQLQWTLLTDTSVKRTPKVGPCLS